MNPRVMNMKVAKFGGSSLADASQIKKVCDILLSDKSRRFLVVSAPGKRYKSDIKVTDLLIALAEARLAGKSGEKELHAVLKRYEEIASELGATEVITTIASNLRELSDADRSSPGSSSMP